MFDGLTNTHFYSKSNRKADGFWAVAFEANTALVTTGYKVTTGWNSEKWKGRSPKKWALYGKANSNDEWKLIDYTEDSKMGDINCKTYTFSCTPGIYRYFRWHVYDVNGGDAIQVSEFNIMTQATNDIGEMLFATGGTQRSDGADKYDYMFNDDSSNYWYCPNEEKQNGVWFVEFQSYKPQEPKAYKFYSTFQSPGDLANCHPKNWKLYGKLDQEDKWTVIDERTNEDLPHEDTVAKEFAISKRGEYQYYRLEVSENNGGVGVIIGRFEFVY